MQGWVILPSLPFPALLSIAVAHSILLWLLNLWPYYLNAEPEEFSEMGMKIIFI
jgi:hypothetical protein